MPTQTLRKPTFLGSFAQSASRIWAKLAIQHEMRGRARLAEEAILRGLCSPQEAIDQIVFRSVTMRRQHNYEKQRLQGIEGIGADKAANLLEEFGSLEAIAEAPLEELVRLRGIGRVLARRIMEQIGDLI